MKKLLFNTSNTWSPFFLRIILGIVFFAHGAQKLMGWFGGYGFKGTMAYFTDIVGLPWIIGFTVIFIEFVGSLALILGWATRVWSLAFILLNFGIIATVHYQYFFMNWFGNQKIEGYEYFLLAISMALSLVFTGAGRLSLDQKLSMQYIGLDSTSFTRMGDQHKSA